MSYIFPSFCLSTLFFTAGGLREEAARDRGPREEDAAPVVCRPQRAIGEGGVVHQVQESREGGNKRGGLKMHKEYNTKERQERQRHVRFVLKIWIHSFLIYPVSFFRVV